MSIRILPRPHSAWSALSFALQAALPSASQTGVGADDPVRIERSIVTMGTSLVVEVEANSRPVAIAASEAAVTAIQATEARVSTWRVGTEFDRINRSRVGDRVALSVETVETLERVWHFASITDGAFDPTIGALVRCWDLRGAGRYPSRSELHRALANTGVEHLELDHDRVTRRSAGVLLEEGAFAKGLALDAAIAALRERGVRATLDFGRQLISCGHSDRDCRIAHPRHRDRTVATVHCGDRSVATSGNGERGRIVDGKRIGHILDPRTGQPAPDFGSITVITASAFDADCLATALFVLGPERALQFADRHTGIEVVVVELKDELAPPIVRVSKGINPGTREDRSSNHP